MLDLPLPLRDGSSCIRMMRPRSLWTMCSNTLSCMICPRLVSRRRPMFKQLVDHCCHVDYAATVTRLRAFNVAEFGKTSDWF
eukprot:5161991-Heterocapsa_arctica.AAC.1